MVVVGFIGEGGGKLVVYCDYLLVILFRDIFCI